MSQPADRWWLTSENLDQLPQTTFEELVQRPDLAAIVIMYDCNSQGVTFWRVFTWLVGSEKRYLNMMRSRPLNLWVPPANITVKPLFGDGCFWLLTTEAKLDRPGVDPHP